MCDRTTMLSEENRCGECAIREIRNNEDRVNQGRFNEEEVERREHRVNEESDRRRQRCVKIKVKGGNNKNKAKEITRLFSLNCNGFDPESNDKIDKVIK